METSTTAPAPAATPGDARRPLTRRDTRVDLWITALTAALGLVTLWLSAVIVEDAEGAGSPSTLESVLWLLGLCAPLAFRRQRPVGVLVVVSAVFLAAQLRGYPDTLTPSIVEFVVIFTANAWAARRSRALVVSVVVTAVMFVWLGVWLHSVYVSDAEAPDPVTLATIAYTLVSNGIVLVTAIAFGRAARVSATRLHALERTGVELRAAHELVADRAINEERTRLARELHDVVAHHVAVIGIQAGAARRTLDRPDIARGALSAVEGTARTTIVELDRLLSVLRSRDGEAGSGPSGLGALPELMADTRALGLEVRFSVHGDARDVPESIGVTLYRITQEALTNTLKHGNASLAEVHLRYGDRTIEVEVVDDGRPGPTPYPGAGISQGSTATGPGLGQRGMRERVDLHGGELQLGPRPRGGYRVCAVLPVNACTDARPLHHVTAADPTERP
ncbi:sensor histidine kinase [Frigoribacterium sp. CFBP 13605]|uniref:sensor histidine kinase n=1 Tax=Frigoribacterium sp. CFBP 13605 TaxID=2774034 RepID=UPI001902DB5A|nr:sensor histidine kinase [Frigoribacterium sp. CFBP 13605]MBD8139074.1 sensor histidine kinase [Frigoribacterium sp. CFBP 13605]